MKRIETRPALPPPAQSAVAEALPSNLLPVRMEPPSMPSLEQAYRVRPAESFRFQRNKSWAHRRGCERPFPHEPARSKRPRVRPSASDLSASTRFGALSPQVRPTVAASCSELKKYGAQWRPPAALLHSAADA